MLVLALSGPLNAGYRVCSTAVFCTFGQHAEGFPIELWFAYGTTAITTTRSVRPPRGALPTMADRRQMLRQFIIEQYSSRSPLEQLDFMTRKTAITWGDGMYDAQEFLATPLKANWTHRFILASPATAHWFILLPGLSVPHGPGAGLPAANGGHAPHPLWHG